MKKRTKSTSKRLVLVVHGIGEQSPGQTLDRLVGAATGNRASRVESEKRLLQDEHDNADRRAMDLFECEIRKVTTDKSNLTFAEVYWADLSRGKVGQLATLYELVKGILGIGHLVRENAEELYPGRHGRWSRWLANRLVALLHGPVAVLNLLLAAGAASVYGAVKLLPAAYAVHAACAVLSLVAILAGYFAHKRTDSYLFKIFAGWLFGSGIALVGLIAITLIGDAKSLLSALVPEVACTGHTECQFVWYSLAMIGALNLAWLLMLAGVMVLVTVQGLRDLKSGETDPRSIYAVSCAVMTVLWMVVGSMVWASLSVFIDKMPANAALRRFVLEQGTGLISVTLVAFAAIIIVSGIVWLRRLKWAKAHDTKSFKDRQLRRLILNLNVRRAFIFATLLLSLGAASLTWSHFAGANGFHGRIAALISTNYPIAFTVALAVTAVYSVAWSQLATGLGIAKDVITYFKGEPTAGDQTRQQYPLRARMHHRFVTVMETMIASEKPDKVAIIAHSQGTVIVIEAIRGNNTSMLFDREHIKERVLVTMGSPFSHIYEHYFQSKFQLPTDFDKRLDSWLNIFRIDDFVGTTVGPPDGEWPQNIPVNAKGHTGYWTDGDVLDLLVEKVLPELA